MRTDDDAIPLGVWVGEGEGDELGFGLRGKLKLSVLTLGGPSQPVPEKTNAPARNQ